jgi:hypothetical protein
MQAQTGNPQGKQGGPRQELPTSDACQELPASRPSPPVTSTAQWSLGDQVQAKYKGQWYTGKIQGLYPKGHLVLFDGYESQGALKTAFNQIRPFLPVDSASNSTERTPSFQPVHFTASTPLRSEGHFSTTGPAQQQDVERDDNENEGSGGGGWGSDTTPNVFRQLSGDPYCVTRVIHDDKVRHLQNELEELRRAKAALLDTNAILRDENEELKVMLQVTELQSVKDRDDFIRIEQHRDETLQKLGQVEKDRDDALQRCEQIRGEYNQYQSRVARHDTESSPSASIKKGFFYRSYTYEDIRLRRVSCAAAW